MNTFLENYRRGPVRERARDSAVLEERLEKGDRLVEGHQLTPFTLGRLTEVSGGGVLTLACSFLRRAQEQDQSVVWLSSRSKPFYPPDVQAAGVDLKRLPLLFLPRPADAARVATRLLSSGGFDLMVWDLASWKKAPARLPVSFLGRLNAQARHHRCSVLILTEKTEQDPSLGCLVGLRLQVAAQEDNPGLLEVRVVKDKRGAVGEGKCWRWRCRLPDGLPASTPFPAATVVPSAPRMVG